MACIHMARHQLLLTMLAWTSNDNTICYHWRNIAGVVCLHQQGHFWHAIDELFCTSGGVAQPPWLLPQRLQARMKIILLRTNKWWCTTGIKFMLLPNPQFWLRLFLLFFVLLGNKKVLYCSKWINYIARIFFHRTQPPSTCIVYFCVIWVLYCPGWRSGTAFV